MKWTGFPGQAIVSLMIAAAILGTSASDASAFKALATVVGAAQGQIQGDSTSKEGPGAIMVREISHEIVSPRDPASGLPTGKRQHKPFQIVKDPDKATPRLLMALVTNETLTTVEIKFFRTVSTGQVVHYHTVKLTDAQIAGFRTIGDPNVAGGVVEIVSFVYDKIAYTDVINKFTAQDEFDN